MIFDYFTEELDAEFLAFNPVASLDAAGRIEVWVLLRPDPESPLQSYLDGADQQPFGKRTWLSGAQIRELASASEKDIQTAADRLREYGLEIAETDKTMRCIKVRGTPEAWSAAVDVALSRIEYRGMTYCVSNNPGRGPSLSDDTASGIVQDIIGLDEFAHAIAKSLDIEPDSDPSTVTDIQRGRFTPEELAEIYRFPKGFRGKGQKIGIWSLGGGVHLSEIEEYARRYSPAFDPNRQIAFVGPNRPGDVAELRGAVKALWGMGEQAMSDIDVVWALETTLDVELLAGLADQAEQVIYFPEDSSVSHEKTIVDTLRKIVFDDEHQPSVIAASWASYEKDISPGFAAYLDHWLEILTKLRGITFLFSSGNWGSYPEQKTEPTLGFPASSPHVLGCGGTSLISGPGRERVWNEIFKGLHMASTGGFSLHYSRPGWQANACNQDPFQGRGVPDLAATTDFRCGIHLLIGGIEVGSAGTSSSSQVWAALLSRINQGLGFPAGYLNPVLYGLPQQSFRDVVHGQNNRFEHSPRFTARSGWDPCSGLGAPDGEALLRALKRK